MYVSADDCLMMESAPDVRGNYKARYARAGSSGVRAQQRLAESGKNTLGLRREQKRDFRRAPLILTTPFPPRVENPILFRLNERIFKPK